MKSTQAIRQMNLSSTHIDSEQLSELAEPVAVHHHPDFTPDVELPEIVVTFRDVTSALDEILTAHEDGIPEYVSFGDQIAAPELEHAETGESVLRDDSREDDIASELGGKFGTPFEGSLGSKIVDDLSDPASNDAQLLLDSDPSLKTRMRSRPVDEDLLDHLLGEITATFHAADEVATNDGNTPARSVRQPPRPAASFLGEASLDTQSSADFVAFDNAESNANTDSDALISQPPTSRSWHDNAAAENQETAATEGASPTIELQTSRDQNRLPNVEESRLAAPDVPHLVKVLQWEPIPTATGLIDTSQLTSSKVVGIYRDSEAVDETQFTEDGPAAEESECVDAEVEIAQLEISQTSTTEFAIISAEDALTLDSEDNASGLLSEIADYNRSSVDTIPAETIRPMRAEPARLDNREFESQYVELVDALCERTPALSSPILMFGAADDLPSAGRCVQQIAMELASRPNTKRVLLVDGRTRLRALSKTLAAENAPGLAEVLLEDVDWSNYVHTTTTENLDFLPAGNGLLSICQPIEDKLKQISVDWKSAYDYVLIDGGDPNDVIPRLWCSLCDATYLLVTLGQTETISAKAAVTELRAYGARLLGCVVCAPSRVF